MSLAENVRLQGRRLPWRPQRRAYEPALLCLSSAAIEGSVAGLLLLLPTLFYHFVLLDAANTFPWRLYLTFVALLAGFHAAFSANAMARFLAGERQRVTTLPAALFAWSGSFAAMLMIAFLCGRAGELSRISLTVAYVLGIPVTVGVRNLIQSVLSHRIHDGDLHFQKIAIVGTHASVVSFLLSGELWRHGQSIAGTLYLEDVTRDGVLQLGAVSAFAADVVRGGAHYLVITGDVADIGVMAALTSELKRFALNVVYDLAADDLRLDFLDVVPIGAHTTLQVLRQPLRGVSLFLKRTLDLAGASAGLLLLAPLLLLVAIAIKLDSPGPVIYRQERRGFNGQSFTIFKFRSMSVLESGRSMRQAELGDRRITRVGRLLRKTSLDELPQLLNVLAGQMSLVGPRPHAVSHDDELSRRVADYAHRQRIKPGITGWAQISGYRGETVTLEQIEGRTLHDLYYIDNWSIYFDIWVLLLTVVSPSSHRDAF